MNIANSILCEPTVSNSMVNSKINKINKHTEMKLYPRAAVNISKVYLLHCLLQIYKDRSDMA